jgi:hypothetical protein
MDGWMPVIGTCSQFSGRTEHFSKESEALNRAEELLVAGVHHRVAVIDDADNVLDSIRLDLKIGAGK